MRRPPPLRPRSNPVSVRCRGTGPEFHVYDFDGTLFRSPGAPASWRGAWWSHLQSLTPPEVPAFPGPEWWNQPTLESLRRSLARSNTVVALLTGRKRSVFSARVHELLEQQGLDFDLVALNPRPLSRSNEFKAAWVEAYLRVRPETSCVMIVEDKLDSLEGMVAAARRAGREVAVDLVRENARARQRPAGGDWRNNQRRPGVERTSWADWDAVEVEREVAPWRRR